MVIVTSRTVVADRFRFPDGTIFVKIEPFSENKISRWLQSWNSANDAYFKSRGLSPIPREAVLRHRDLAQQPLLLLMLALYDAGSNALQRNRGELARADLYERLLSAFVSRELDKYQLHLDSSTHAWRVDRELQRLSVMAFALFNRGRHTVTESDLDVDLGDLDADLAFLLPWNYDPEDMASGFARDLTPAQLVVGRFFFVHQSRTLVDGGWRNSYEFLNVAFGEYLVARMVFHILNRIAELRAADNQSFAPGISSNSADEHLWALLSFAPLTDWPQTVSFLAELFQQLADARCIEHWQTLSALFRKSLQPRKNGYGGYEPLFLNAPARHAAYSVNLAVLNLLAASRPISIKTLLATADLTVEEWQRFVLLWRSQLSSTSWQGLVGAKLFAESDEFNLNETILKFLTTTGAFKEVASSGKQDEIQVSSPVSNASKRKSGEYAHPNIRPLRAFVSYSQKDERHRQALDAALAQLKRNALISVWHDRKILPGQGWDEEIDKNLEIADIILVLVSFDFLNSDYAYTREMQRAIERHKSGSATVVPIILRPSDWQTSPLGDLQALPSNGRPVSRWPNRDLAWLDVVQGLQELLSGQG